MERQAAAPQINVLSNDSRKLASIFLGEQERGRAGWEATRHHTSPTPTERTRHFRRKSTNKMGSTGVVLDIQLRPRSFPGSHHMMSIRDHNLCPYTTAHSKPAQTYTSCKPATTAQTGCVPNPSITPSSGAGAGRRRHRDPRPRCRGRCDIAISHMTDHSKPVYTRSSRSVSEMRAARTRHPPV